MIASSAQLVASAATRTRWSWLQSAAEMAALYSGDWPDDTEPAGTRWPSAARVATRSPEPTARSIATARTFSLRTLERWGASDCASDVTAVVSELLTNALRHALPQAASDEVPGRPIRLGLLHPGPCVLCAVADPSAQTPVLREPDWLAESGRGLQVVASLSSQWGFCIAPGMQGKVVWATFAVTA